MKSLVKYIYILFFFLLVCWTLNNVNASPAPNQKQDCPGGICADTKSLMNWTSKMDVYKTLWIRKDTAENTTVMSFVQDIIHAATYFIWTVVTAALIVSWLMMVFSWADSSLRNKARSWFKYALIGLVVVILSIVIVRTVQFIAKGWS